VSRRRAEVFRYIDIDVDAARGDLVCRYALDDLGFEERISVGAPTHDAGAALHEAARIVHLLAGVSYYKAGAPATIDLGDVGLRPGERALMHDYYLHGLGEFAYRNAIELDVTIVGGREICDANPYEPIAGCPLVPFGGGKDSLVTVESIRRTTESPSLFIVNHRGSRFETIEGAAAATGLPIVRAERQLDPKVLRSDELGYLNGHVPVTGIISSIAVLAAVAHGHDAVVMSNERSASSGNVDVDGRIVNHQWSKGIDFENGFRRLLASSFVNPPEYFSLLRPWTELAIARAFAGLPEYHLVFHSCNRAMHAERERRLSTWCGRCDKCCFVDLILSPFLSADELGGVFQGREPLTSPDLLEQFRTLLGLTDDFKPFECVGEVDECRTAAVLASDRRDRRGSVVLGALVDELGDNGAAAARRAEAELLSPAPPSNVPAPHATSRLLG
jgi:UDP-N-acetyl-alpha-D-muramoyl-L-alanyl-L-glutamate epimerase